MKAGRSIRVSLGAALAVFVLSAPSGRGVAHPSTEASTPSPDAQPPSQQDASPGMDATPGPDAATPDAPSPSLPSDAISSAANRPDEGPSPDAPAADSPPVANIAPAPPPAPPAPDITVLDSQLLGILTDSAGTDTITPTTAIPYVVGRSCYSWALKYQPVAGDLVLSEELVLPGPARNWTPASTGKTEVNTQGSGAITERHFDAATGAATAGWCVAKDDPVGAYRYIIRQGEREVARFDFTVGDLL
ncbi:MAG TPA: hypothetical protein VF503_02975 [Sphingobium sp.]|uniref:hypothetical protein n=1 Tax=Sphingobium sp. TaxID=1912891 RepID=UPI002ED2128E